MKKESKPSDIASNRWLKRIWGALPLLFLLIMMAGIWILYGKIGAKQERLKEKAASELRQEEVQANVVALKIVPEPIRDRIRFPGITQPSKKVKLLAEVKGKVIQKNPAEGKKIQKGDVVVALDSRDYENALSAARAAYGAAEASLNRIQLLFQKKAAAQAQLDAALAQALSLKASMENAALALERCTVRSPLDGILDRIHLEEGDFVGVGDPVAEIIQIDPVKVQVGIPESDVDAVRRVDTFDVAVDALSGKVFRGKKDFLSKTADPVARLYNLHLILDNASRDILPDMFVKVEIVKKEIPEGISVPLYAVINRNAENVVFVVNDDHVHPRAVHLGLMDGWKVEVKAGLKAGDRVIVVGHRDVNPGQKVTVVKTVDRIEDLSR